VSTPPCAISRPQLRPLKTGAAAATIATDGASTPRQRRATRRHCPSWQGTGSHAVKPSPNPPPPTSPPCSTPSSSFRRRLLSPAASPQQTRAHACCSRAFDILLTLTQPDIEVHRRHDGFQSAGTCAPLLLRRELLTQFCRAEISKIS
jgi:hypothetical protein